jgi:hypothetical protein
MVASGLGSTLSLRLVAGSDRRLRRVLGGVVAAVAFGASPLVNAAAGWPLAAKVILTAAMVAPAAFLMGIPFPSGLRRLEKMHAPSVRWAWAVNAASERSGIGRRDVHRHLLWAAHDDALRGAPVCVRAGGDCGHLTPAHPRGVIPWTCLRITASAAMGQTFVAFPRVHPGQGQIVYHG